MSWQDPKGPWAKAMRRRVYGLTALFAPVLVAGGMGMLFLRGSFWGLVVLVPASVLGVVFTVLGLILARRERSLLRLIPLHEGMICPKCRVVLQVSPGGVLCPRCQRQYTADEVRTFWEHYALATLSAAEWFRTRMGHQETRRQPWWRRFLFEAIIVLLFIASTILIGRFTGGSFLGNLVSQSPQMLGTLVLVILMDLIIRQIKQPPSQDRFCATCGYQQTPGAENPPRCPECGAAWTLPGGSILGGRRRVRRVLRWWILPLVFAAGLFPLVSFKCNRMRLLPTGALIDHTVSTQGYADEGWTALRLRTLSPAQEIRLANGLLDKRLQRRFLSKDDEAWFTACLAKGTLPRTIVERYYREMLKIWVDAPATAKVGERFRVSLGSEEHHNLYSIASGASDGFVCFAGFLVDDSPSPTGRSERTLHLTLLDHPEYEPAAALIPQHAGPQHIRAIAWLVVAPNGMSIPGPIQWQDDGTPVIPPGVEWAERVEAETTVQVHE